MPLNEQEYDALVSALRQQAKAIDRLADGLARLAASIMLMVESEPPDEPSPPTTYMDGTPI